MKELYLTITDMTFLAEGRVLGRGRTVAAAAGPEQPGDLSLALAGGTARMGTFYPAEGETPRGHWQAVLEGQELPLSPKEFDLLYHLYSNPDTAFTQEQLYEAVWHQPAGGWCHAVENTVFQIRKRLRPFPGGKGLIRTVPRYGYKYGG